MVSQESVDAHHHPRSAESTLGTMAFSNPFLDRVYSGFGASYAFYCSDSSSMERADGDQAGSGREMTDVFGDGVVS